MIMSKVPWFPPNFYPKHGSVHGKQPGFELPVIVNAEESSITAFELNKNLFNSQTSLLNDYMTSSTTSLGNNSTKSAEKPKKPAKRNYRHIKHSGHFLYTKEELTAKRLAAIEEEALKKVVKDEIVRTKQEARWIEIGQIICSLSLEDFGLSKLPKVDVSDEITGDEVLSNVANFVSNLRKFVGHQTKGTMLANFLAFTGALCGVNPKSIVFVDRRVKRARKTKEERILREKDKKDELNDRWIEIGKAICSFNLGDFGITIDSKNAQTVHEENSETVLLKERIVETEDVVCSTLKALSSLESESNDHSGESDYEYNEDEEETDEEFDEEDDCDDFAPPPRKKSKGSKKTLAWRGEDVVANVFHFSTALRELMGVHTKHTALRSVHEFTSVFCNVAEKSVRDRHSQHISIPRKRKSKNPE